MHFGHLNLAIEIKEKRQLDQVIFFPAYANPNKFLDTPQESFASAEDRLQMVRLALEGIPGLSCSALEYSREGPSFTIETLHAFVAQQQEPQELFLILGLDAALHLHQWKEPEEVIKLATPLVGVRPLSLQGSLKFQGSQELTDALQEGIVETRLMDISATEIRNRLAHGLYCGHLLPGKVMDYIKAHRLYFSL
jgi:nicotinate-nucleotide adenylyltransferase